MKKKYRFGKYNVEASHLDKIFFPDAGLTKGDIIEYYKRIAEFMIPHMKDRPVTMHRFPDGIDGNDFYHKNIPDYFPEWIDRTTAEKEGGEVTYVVCNNSATLVYIANQACITPHIWLSRHDRINYPDKLIFDLDPPEGVEDISPVIFAAKRIREILEESGLKPFIMTSGSKGYHVVAPIKREHTFEEVREYAKRTAKLLAKHESGRLTTETLKEKRKGRVFLDYLRNSYGATSVSPYALRAKPGAPVAAPIHWDELENVPPRRFKLTNIFDRLDDIGDPWKDIFRHLRSLEKAIGSIEKAKRS